MTHPIQQPRRKEVSSEDTSHASESTVTLITLSSSLLLSPPLNVCKDHFSVKISGNFTGLNIDFCIQEMKVKQANLIFVRVLREFASESLFDTSAEKLESKIITFPK